MLTLLSNFSPNRASLSCSQPSKRIGHPFRLQGQKTPPPIAQNANGLRTAALATDNGEKQTARRGFNGARQSLPATFCAPKKQAVCTKSTNNSQICDPGHFPRFGESSQGNRTKPLESLILRSSRGGIFAHGCFSVRPRETPHVFTR